MIKKLVIAIALLSIASLTATAQTNKVSFAWDPTCNTNVASYVVYYGTNTLTTPLIRVSPANLDDCGINRPAETNLFKGSYTFTNIVNGYTSTNAVITNLVKGAKYYFTLTAKTFNGLESDQSNEIEYTVPLYSSNSVPSKVRGTRIIEIK